MILEWRNSPDIKNSSFTQNDITLADHLSFIETLKNSIDKLYFLVQKDGQNIGVISFVNITKNSTDFGLYSNPNLKGYGKILLETIINFAFETLQVKKIVAEVFYTNQKAYNLYKNHGFVQTAEKSINNQKIICMELEKA
jgi:UDP-4-amino-4,6-dideoxy-N-acetyl-beta-L-altrosamine N-acetyltransferase